MTDVGLQNVGRSRRQKKLSIKQLTDDEQFAVGVVRFIPANPG